MTKQEKLKSLIRYQALLETRQSSAIPEKHKQREKTYRAFLANELKLVINQITALKESVV